MSIEEIAGSSSFSDTQEAIRRRQTQRKPQPMGH